MENKLCLRLMTGIKEMLGSFINYVTILYNFQIPPPPVVMEYLKNSIENFMNLHPIPVYSLRYLWMLPHFKIKDLLGDRSRLISFPIVQHF